MHNVTVRDPRTAGARVETFRGPTHAEIVRFGVNDEGTSEKGKHVHIGDDRLLASPSAIHDEIPKIAGVASRSGGTAVRRRGWIEVAATAVGALPRLDAVFVCVKPVRAGREAVQIASQSRAWTGEMREGHGSVDCRICAGFYARGCNWDGGGGTAEISHVGIAYQRRILFRVVFHASLEKKANGMETLKESMEMPKMKQISANNMFFLFGPPSLTQKK